MKRILFILLSALFLQTTMCIYLEINALNAAEIPICALANDLKSNLSDEEWTENNFYKFIRYDVIGKDNPIPKGILYYTELSSANEVYGKIINWIVPTSERQAFAATKTDDKTKKDNKIKTYNSNVMVVSYTEEVKEGFAELTVTFKKRKDLKQCTVVFKPKK